MSVCFTADQMFTAGQTNLLIQFCIQQDDGSGTGTLVPIPDANTATVTWVAANGQRRLLSLVTPASAIFGWVTSAGEMNRAHSETGRCYVQPASGGGYYTQPFVITVDAVF